MIGILALQIDGLELQHAAPTSAHDGLSLPVIGGDSHYYFLYLEIDVGGDITTLDIDQH